MRIVAIWSTRCWVHSMAVRDWWLVETRHRETIWKFKQPLSLQRLHPVRPTWSEWAGLTARGHQPTSPWWDPWHTTTKAAVQTLSPELSRLSVVIRSGEIWCYGRTYMSLCPWCFLYSCTYTYIKQNIYSHKNVQVTLNIIYINIKGQWKSIFCPAPPAPPLCVWAPPYFVAMFSKRPWSVTKWMEKLSFRERRK